MRSFTHTRSSRLSVLALSMGAAMFGSLAAERAHACGGLFCASVSPTPVDQSAERILFEVLDDGTVAATVEIKYQGDPLAFSWIVPVGGTPAFVEVAPKDQLNLLDAATRPSIVPPTQVCSNQRFSPSFGCSEALSGVDPAASANESVLDDGTGGVDVTRYPSVGPYDQIVVVDGFDPQTLMDWLNDNGYQVTEEMRPFIAQYTLEGYSFLATKLAATADVRDMVPIRFHCPMPFPEIPLRLTAIAAEPQMGFLVFILADGRYRPSNYSEVHLEPSQIQTVGGVSNYFGLVSKVLDDEGGLGFVLERAQPAPDVRTTLDNTFLGTEEEDVARTSLEDVLGRRRYLTRLYARIDPDEMIEDPQFIPGDGAGRFDGVHDLSARSIEVCPDDGEDISPNALGAPTCGLLYCGAGDSCATSNAFGDGCVCGENRVARAISSPSGGVQVACTSLAIDLHGGNASPCEGFDCGRGLCVPVNDRPTCSCDDDAVAVIDENQRLTCVERTGKVHGPEQILWPEPAPVDPAARQSGCAAPTGNRAGGSLSLLLLLSTPLVLRLASRKRS